ncbi:unnamed protein product [Mytilus edulis]|uniref:Reverse transcriptase domain-containing protein n=1 Tax=Mytilus edulis TaxID=6550 RepID=A0A8S3T2Y8_MYTED|nr:unnamed protein product [Mytilus edulis]
MTAAKRILRKAQRQAYASQRESTAGKIMKASNADTKLFYKLINMQRKTPLTNTKILKLNEKTAEDGPSIMNIWQETGILTPILKKEKDKTLPSSYRGMTVTKTFAKILQSILLKDRVNSVFNIIQNSMQRGFTEGVSSLCAAFLTSKAIEGSKQLKILLILITLDAEKAFNKLNHEILFNKLYHYGTKGKPWILLRNLYKGMSIKVKWEGQCTEDVMVLQGIQQGAKLSTTLYKCYNNVILDSILKSGLGACIGDIQVPAPTCADDIAVLANSTADATKSEAVLYNAKGSNISTLQFEDNDINITNETKHLGIKRNEQNRANISERIRTGRATIYSLLGAGLHVRRGFSPMVAYKLWRTYAVPRSIYGLEVMNLLAKEKDMLELAERKFSDNSMFKGFQIIQQIWLYIPW